MRRGRRQGRSRSQSERDGGSPAPDERASSRTRRGRVERLHGAAGNQVVQRQRRQGGAPRGQQDDARGRQSPARGQEGRKPAQKDEESRAWQPIEDTSEYDVEIPQSTLHAAVVIYLRSEGIRPPEGSGLELEDYVETTAWKSDGSYSHTTASVRLARDGTLLPTDEYIDEHRPEGGYATHSLRPAARELEFQISRWGPEHVVVFSSVTNVESSRIEKQEDATKEDTRWGFLTGLEEATEKAGIELGGAGTGRVPPDERVPTDADDGSGASPTQSNDGATTGGGQTSDDAQGGTTASPDGATTSSDGTSAGASAGNSSYVVEKGDTLWDIAEREYGDAQKWPVIYEAQASAIEDPDLIHPGQTLTIPPQRAADAFDRSEYTAPASTGLGEGTF